MRRVIPIERLQAVADLAPKPEEPPRSNNHHTPNGEGRRLLVDDYLRHYGIGFTQTDGKGGDKFVLDECPFDSSHKRPDSYVMQYPSGMQIFHCSHNSCSDKKWKDFRAIVGEPLGHHYDPPKPDYKSRHNEQQQHSQAEPEKPLDRAAVNFSELKTQFPDLKPELIEGILRISEVMGIHAKSKVGKSWFVYMIALAVATGTWLFGRYRCHRGRVLIIDNELHGENLVNRIPKVAKGMGLTGMDWENNLDLLPLRGRLRNIFEMRAFFESIDKGQYSLIIIDALYRILPEGISEKGNAEMAQVMNALDSYAGSTGAAIAFVHHASKGDQSGKDVTDVGSGAGSLARAVDSHLVLRPHEERDHVVLDAALRSFAPIDPVVLGWEFPVWQIAEDMDPAALKGRKVSVEENQDKKDAEGMQAILEALEKHGGMSKNKLSTKAGIGKTRIERLLGKLEQNDEITCTEGIIGGNKCEIYEINR